MQTLKWFVALVWLCAAALCMASPATGEFEGHYRVGTTSCTVTPVKMAFELRWARGKGTMPFFFERETGDGKFIFASEERPEGKDRFEFDDKRLASGRFVRADGKIFPVQKISR